MSVSGTLIPAGSFQVAPPAQLHDSTIKKSVNIDLSEIQIQLVPPPTVQPTQTVPMAQEIRLEEFQVAHYNKVREILDRNISYMDTSPTGSGKTIIAIAMAIVYECSMFVICPSKAVFKWQEHCEKYGVKAIVLSYEEFRGRANKKEGTHNFKHGYIQGIPDADGVMSFYTTQKFANLAAGKVMVIFDEAQKAKNQASTTLRVCHTLTKYLVKINNGSKIGALSATPFDKEIFAESFLKLLGVITVDTLFFYNVGMGKYQLEGRGYEQALNYSYLAARYLAKKGHNFEKKTADQVVEECKPLKYSAINFRRSLYKIHCNIIKHLLGSAMPRPKIDGKFIGINKYYRMSPESQKAYLGGLSALRKAVNYDEATGTVNHINNANGGIAAVARALHVMEIATLEVLVRGPYEVLCNDPYSKVIIYVWHDDVVDYLLQAFANFNPLRCDGKVNKKKVGAIINAFQAHDLTYRVLISKPTALDTAVDLDDTHGKLFRHMFISPSYHFNNIHQAAGRFYRMTTKSDAQVTLIYVKDIEALPIFNALHRKSEVTKGASVRAEIDDDDEYVAIDTPFPSEYTREEEE